MTDASLFSLEREIIHKGDHVVIYLVRTVRARATGWPVPFLTTTPLDDTIVTRGCQYFTDGGGRRPTEPARPL